MSLLTNLQAAYNFDSSPGNLADSSGNGYTLTNNGTVTFSSGLIGSCAVFGTSNSSKYLNNATNLGLTSGTQNWSLSYWFESGNVGEICGLVQLNYGGGTNGFRIALDGGNNRFQLHNIVSGIDLIPSYSASTNTWYHVCVVNSSNTATLYVNNVSEGTLSFSSTTTGMTDGIEIGYSPQQIAYGNGNVDILNVWGRALTTGEVATLYNGGAGLQYPFGLGNSGFLEFI